MSIELFVGTLEAAVVLTLLVWALWKHPWARIAAYNGLLVILAILSAASSRVDSILCFGGFCVLFWMIYRTVTFVEPSVGAVALAVQRFKDQLQMVTQFGPETPPDELLYSTHVVVYNDDHEFEVDELGIIGDEDWIKKLQVLIDLEVFRVYFTVFFALCTSVLVIGVFFIVLAYVKGMFKRARRGYQEISGEVFEMKDFVAERMAPGSQFLPVGRDADKKLLYPKMQASVMISVDGGKFVYSGQGFRVGDHFWTAAHVIEEADEVMLVNPRNEKTVTLLRKDFKKIEGDIAVASLGNGSLSVLGLSNGKFANQAADEKMAAYVEITALDKKSLGLLTPHSSFSYVTYSGSTISGFSGAPYLVNNTIFGMHIGHQTVNLGYDGCYLGALAKMRGVLIREESTVDFIFDYMSRSAKKLKFQRSPYDPDEWVVRVGGKYHVISDDDYEVLQDRYQEQYEDRYDDDLMFDWGEDNRNDVDYTPRRSGGFDRANRFLESAVVNEVQEMMALKGVMTPKDLAYTDSGNGSRAPVGSSADAGALGSAQLSHVIVPTAVMQKQFPTPTSQFPAPLKNLVTGLPVSMPVEQSPALDSIQSEVQSDPMIDMSAVVKEAMRRVMSRKCSKCKKLGHVRKDCPKKSSSQSSQLQSKRTAPGDSQSQG